MEKHHARKKKERFARWAMSGEKVEEHSLISEVGMKSRLKIWVGWSGEALRLH